VGDDHGEHLQLCVLHCFLDLDTILDLRETKEMGHLASSI